MAHILRLYHEQTLSGVSASICLCYTPGAWRPRYSEKWQIRLPMKPLLMNWIILPG